MARRHHGVGSTAVLKVSLIGGRHVLTLQATDNFNETVTDTVIVDVWLSVAGGGPLEPRSKRGHPPQGPGAQGDPGPPGATGPPGPVGPAGPAERSVRKDQKDLPDHRRVRTAGSRPEGDFRGPGALSSGCARSPGPIGPQGLQGPPGAGLVTGTVPHAPRGQDPAGRLRADRSRRRCRCVDMTGEAVFVDVAIYVKQ